MEDFVSKLNSLTPEEKDFLASDETMVNLKKSFVMFGINSALSERISREVANIFVGILRLESLPEIIKTKIGLANRSAIFGIAYEISMRIFNRFPSRFRNIQSLLSQWERLKSMPVMNENEALKKVYELEPWILEMEKENKALELEMQEEEKENYNHEEDSEKIEKLNIFDALQKFPEIGEQFITSNRLQTRIYPNPVAPNIKNWLLDYTANIGRDNRDSMKRGIYLFQSANTKALSSEERNRLSAILKSHDEKTPIAIDTENQKVLFNETENYEKNSSLKMPAFQYSPYDQKNTLNERQPKNENVSFSSPQILPFEKTEEKNNIQIRPIQPPSSVPKTEDQPRFQIQPQAKPKVNFQPKPPLRTQIQPQPKPQIQTIAPIEKTYQSHAPYHDLKDIPQKHFQKQAIRKITSVPANPVQTGQRTGPVKPRPIMEEKEIELAPYRITPTNRNVVNLRDNY